MDDIGNVLSDEDLDEKTAEIILYLLVSFKHKTFSFVIRETLAKSFGVVARRFIENKRICWGVLLMFEGHPFREECNQIKS